MNKNGNMIDINFVKIGPYIAEVFLVHLDLSDIRGVVGCVDLVLLFVVSLPIQTLGKRKKIKMFYPVVMYISINTNVSGVNNRSSVSSYFVGDLVSLP